MNNCFDKGIDCIGCYWLTGNGCEYTPIAKPFLRILLKEIKNTIIFKIKTKIIPGIKHIVKKIGRWMDNNYEVWRLK